MPRVFSCETSSSHCSGVLGIGAIVVRTLVNVTSIVQCVGENRGWDTGGSLLLGCASYRRDHRSRLSAARKSDDCGADVPGDGAADLCLLGATLRGCDGGDRNRSLQFFLP